MLSLEDLAGRSERVIHGRVCGLRCATDARGEVFTQVDLEVTAVWKGVRTNQWSLVHPGGRLGERRVVTLGQPEYGLGDEVVLFLASNLQGGWVTVEMGQGRFLVRRDKEGRAWVSNGWLGGPMEGAAGVRLPTQGPLSLDEVRRRVEAVKQGRN